jgi:serine/threonine protein kinase
MDAAAAAHPTDPTLHAYAQGRLASGSVAPVESHLSSCARCRNRVAEISSDSFLDALRSGHAPSDSPPPAGVSITEGRESLAQPPLASSLPPGLADHPDYEILRELGRGGMGVVYLALNRLMGRKEVLKIVSRELMDRRGVLDRFLREIRNAAQLHHPNIVTAYSVIRSGESIAFAMEYVEGYDLAQLVKGRGPLPVSLASNFIYQAAQGLEYAHQKGMVHRDIKPSNLILARAGTRPIVKVLDFGLAKATREGPVDGGLTAEGQMLGTPDYIAPEQSLDAQKADIRADVYSLGCTLYYLLSGSAPFRGSSLYEILQAHHSSEAKSLNLVRPEVPSELAAIVAKMMAKVPARRYQTPGEVARALKPFFKAVEVEAVGRNSEESRASQAVVSEQRAQPRMQPKENRVPSPLEPAARNPLESTPADSRELEPFEIANAEPPARGVTRLAPTRTGSRPPWIWTVLAGAVFLAGLLIAWDAGRFNVKTSNIPAQPSGPSPSPSVDRAHHETFGGQPKLEAPPAVEATSLSRDSYHWPATPVTKPQPPRKTNVLRDEPPLPSAARDPSALSRSQGRPSFLEDEPPVPSAAHGPSALPRSQGRPILVASYCAASPVADGIVRAAEYGNSPYVDFAFTGNDRFGGLQDGMGRPMPGKAPDDLSVRLRAAYSDRSLFLAFQVRDQFVDDEESDRERPQCNDGVEIFLDGDRVSNDFYPPIGHAAPGSSEGFQLIANVAGHKLTTSRDFTINDWKSAANRYEEGYVIEVEIPLALIDVKDGPQKVAAGPGSAINLGLAINDNDAAVHEQTRYAFIRARPSIGSPWIGREDSWSFGIKLAPEPSSSNRGAAAEVPWTPLFNGRDTIGWKPHPRQPGNWHVENGILVGSGPASSYLYTGRGDFRNVHVRVEARINSSGNSGVFLRAPFGPVRPPNKPVYPVGYEGQINCTHGDPNRTGSLYVGNDVAVVKMLNSLVRPLEWFTLEMIAQGDRVIVKVNGRTTADYTDRLHRFASGHIALQQLGPQTVVEFRKIELKEL